MLAALGNGGPHRILVDTGSVGILVPRTVLGPGYQDFDPSDDVTFGFVSSGNAYLGQWVEVQVVLGVPEGWDGTGDFATATLEVFAVDRPDGFDGGTLGIGFAIGKDADGGPARNPLLHLAYGGEALAPSYIIGTAGIDVGLANVPSDGFALVALDRNAAGDDWEQMKGVLTLGASFSVELPLLMDTCIEEMLVFLPVQERPTDFGSSTVPAGTAVRVSVPTAHDGPALGYGFVTGNDGAPMAPSTVEWRAGGHGINTGRNLLAGPTT